MAKHNGDTDFVPSSYRELFDHYFKGDGGSSLVDTLIRSFVPYADDELKRDLKQDIYLRAQDKRIIEIFDATKGNFGGLIFVTTRSICANYLARKGRDPIGGLCKGSLTEVTDDESFEPGMYRLDRIFQSTADLDAAIDARARVAALLAETDRRAAHPENTRDRNLSKVIRLLLVQTDPRDIAIETGVTHSTVLNWIKYLRTLLDPTSGGAPATA